MPAYVIPPVNVDAVAVRSERFGITNDMLVYSSVREAPPPAYVPTTIYELGEECSTGVPGKEITCWRSLQGGNQNHAPAEGAWWTQVDTTLAEWNSAQAYEPGDLVLRTATHMVYKRVTAGASAEPPEKDVSGVNWTREGPTNRWAMFEMLSAVPTRTRGPVTIRLRPGRITALAMLEASDGRVTMEMHDAYDQLVWGPIELSTDATPIASWEDYFFASFQPVSNLVRVDLPTYTDGVITIHVEASGEFSLRWLVVGTAQHLGATRYGPRISNRDASVVTRDKNTNELIDVLRQRSIALVSQNLWSEKPLVLGARRALTVAGSVPCVFIGLEDQTDEYAELLTFLGLCTSFEIDLAHPVNTLISMKSETV